MILVAAPASQRVQGCCFEDAPLIPYIPTYTYVPTVLSTRDGKWYRNERRLSAVSELRSWVTVEVDVLGSPSRIVCAVSVDLKQHSIVVYRVQELSEGRGGRLGLPAFNSPYGLCGRKATPNCSISELRSCVKVEVAVLGSPSLIVLMVSVNVKLLNLTSAVALWTDCLLNWPMVCWFNGEGSALSLHTPSTAFRHLPPNSARFRYATEGALFISAQLSSDAVSALR